jgi:hypothetical protein
VHRVFGLLQGSPMANSSAATRNNLNSIARLLMAASVVVFAGASSWGVAAHGTHRSVPAACCSSRLMRCAGITVMHMLCFIHKLVCGICACDAVK